MSDPVIRVRDIAWVRLRVPDLDREAAFLEDFGFAPAARTDRALYVRGTGPAHHVHIVEKADEPGIAGLALVAASAADLDAIAKVPGASPVHDIDEPGGGRRVLLEDPHGLKVEVVHGVATVDPLPTGASLPLNLGGRVERRGPVKRCAKGPARVLRVGHVGVHVAEPDVAFDWYHRHFGMLKSDTLAIEGFTLAHFTRCDRGAELTDHHTVVFARAMDGRTTLNHASFEVVDLDDIWLGNDHLAGKGYRHSWGVGRHWLGSQVFDYWYDPFGLTYEHYTDGDLFDAKTPAGVYDSEFSQWGPQMPPGFGQPPMD